MADTNGGQISAYDEDSTICLNFVVPQHSASGNQDEARSIAKSELWLFPSFNTTDKRWYQLSMGFVFRLEEFNKPVEAEISNILWRGSDDCIMVDLTTQTKIIERKLKKRQLNETVVEVTISVTHKELYHGDVHDLDWQQMCSTLTSRTSNTSFIVVKYFSDEERVSQTTQRKRSTTVVEDDRIPPREGCSLIPHEVRLQDAFGAWVVSPEGPVDVGACSGFCDASTDHHLFTARALLKERLRNLSLAMSPTSSHLFDISCIATEFDPLIFVAHVQERDSYVLLDLPVKAKTCACR